LLSLAPPFTRSAFSQKAEEHLGKFIENIVVSPALIQGIGEGKVDAKFLEHLRELDSKLVFVTQDKAAAKSAAYQARVPQGQRGGETSNTQSRS
jgi:hypothetical protein